jgi:hypothetical protein
VHAPPISSRIWFAASAAGWALALLGIVYASLFVSGETVRKDNIIYTHRFIVQFLAGAAGLLLCAGSALASLVLLFTRRDDRLLLASVGLSFFYILLAVSWLFRKPIFGV